MQEVILWLALLIVLLIVEALTMGLTTIWFAGGALVAWILAMLDVHVGIQIGAFIIVSVALLILTRPIAVKYFNAKIERTNVEGVIGQTGLVTETIDNIRGTGVVVINGLEWSARAEQVIPTDTVVVVKEVQGVKVIVEIKED